MFRKNDPILVVGDDDSELVEIEEHLDIGYSHIFTTTDIDEGATLFEKKRPAALLLSFEQIETAERFYLELFHHCENIYEIPHQTVVFVTRRELDRAYELCRREIFNDFVITRPLLSEHRLRLSVSQALEKRALRLGVQHGQVLLKRLAAMIDNLREEFHQTLSGGQHLIAQQKGMQQDILSSIEYRLGIFRDSLMGPSMHAIVNVQDPAALKLHFEKLQEEEIRSQLEKYHGKMDEALVAWTSNLENHLGLLEQASTLYHQENNEETPTILLIDDDAMQREILNGILSEAGYNVIQAADGSEGLGLLMASIPSLVLLDYEMPGLDGAGLLKKARSTAELGSVPIIMLTGHSEKDVVGQCLGAGATDYLVKPVQRERLLERVAHALA